MPTVFELIERRMLCAVTPLGEQIIVSTDEANNKIALLDSTGTAITTFVAQVNNPQNARLNAARTRILFDGHNADNNGFLVPHSHAICTINVDGSDFQTLPGTGDDSDARWSPDGSKIVFVSYRDGDTAELYVMNADGSNPTRLTNNSAEDLDPTFSPDGKRILFSSDSSGRYQLYTIDAATGGDLKRLTNRDWNDQEPTYSADGGRIAFISRGQGNETTVQLMDARGIPGGFDPQLVATKGSFFQYHEPAFSPDGTQLVAVLKNLGVKVTSDFQIYNSETLQLQDTLTPDTLFQSADWASAPTFAGLFHGLLSVNGTSGKDRISYTGTEQNLILSVNGKSRQYDASAVTVGVQIFAGAGNDTIDGSAAPTAFYAFGDTGDDKMLGGNGKDTLTSGAGRNTLYGGNGDDRLNGSNGRDFIYGDSGEDRIYGNGGNDYILGGGNIDRIWGGEGDDFIAGNGQNDKLFGENGNDEIYGQDGDDLLSGGAGTDTLSGGKGTDTSAESVGSDVVDGVEIVP